MHERPFELPFFEDRHVELAAEIDAWATQARLAETPSSDVDAGCREHVAALGARGFLRHCVPAAFGGARAGVESRTLCIARETLARHDALADFSFAMQGLGSAPLWLSGEPGEASARWLQGVAEGKAIAAFALSEPDAGSDVAAMTTRARRDGDDWLLDGCKTWISNGGIADFYCVFARTSGSAGTRGISAFVVPADAPGLRIAERIPLLAPHPMARIVFDRCRIDAHALLGNEGEGFKLAMRTLDVFRASVGAAAVGLARRALDLSIGHARSRRMFGGTLGERDLARAKLGAMATATDATALLVYRAAWLRDVQGGRTTIEASMAKLGATESAQQVIDAAVQLHGGLGVMAGHPVERLYRDIRALRIYEGASEVQQLIIGKALLDAEGTASS